MLVDKEAKEQGYNIDERDAFMAGIDAWIEYERHQRIGDNTPFINGVKNERWAIKQIENYDPRRFFGHINQWRGGVYYGHEVLDIVKRVMNRFVHIFYVEQETLKDLEGIRDYFGKNDRTPFEHMAFDVIDRIIKTNTP